jgi:DNA polymerase
MPVHESSAPRVLVLGRNPGYTEDRRGFPFVGPAGRMLDEWLLHAGLRRGQDVIVTNLVKCLSPQNREPEQPEVDACMPWLKLELQLFKPQLVIGLGAQVCKQLTGKALNTRRGLVIESQDPAKASTMMTYHPSAAVRSLTFKAAFFADAVPIRRWIEDNR